MKINYTLSNEDYLTFHLYITSKSKTITRNKLRATYIPPLMYMVLSIFFSIKDETTFGIIGFGLLSILWIAFYPKYRRKRFKNHYLKYIDAKYADRINKSNSLEFQDEHILAMNNAIESKINSSELKKLVELKKHFLFEMKKYGSFIVPKESIHNKSELLATLKKYDITYAEDTQWEW